MESKGVNQAQLSRATSLSKSSLSEVLAGKMPFSRQMIRALAGYLSVPVSLLAGSL
jgi:transcriptional regulator with XRE-family HTH domain